jgi:hypothetical protein
MFRFAPRHNIARTIAFSQQHGGAIGSTNTAAAQALKARWLSAAAAPGPKVRV